MAIDYSAYKEAIKAFKEKDLATFDKIKKSGVLSNAERKLLEARNLYRFRKWDEMIELVQSVDCGNDFYMMAEKNALLSFAYSNLDNNEQAFIHSDFAISYYKECENSEFQFQALYNQAVNAQKLRLIAVANHYLNKALEHIHTTTQLLKVNRAIISNYSSSLEYEKAISIIENDLPKLDDLSDRFAKDQYLIIAAEIFFMTKNYKRAQKILNDLADKRSEGNYERIMFHKTLCECVINKQYRVDHWPKSVTSRDKYKHEIEIIESIQRGELQSAKKEWNKLRDQRSTVYGDFMTCLNQSDENSYFMVYLKALMESFQVKEEITNTPDKGKLGDLYQILYQSEAPLDKHTLIEKIWKTSYDTKYDGRLYRLIQRLKKEYNIEVENIKGGYFFKNNN